MNKWLALIAFSVFLLVPVGALEVFAQSDDASIDSSVFTEPSELATPTALASPSSSTILTGPSDFSGSETVIGFESLPGVPSPGPFSIGDVTFSEFSTGSGAPGWRLLTGFLGTPDPQLTDNAVISLIRLDFSSSVNRVGMVVGISDPIQSPTDYEVRFFNSALTLIETVPISVVDDIGKFAGIESTELISRVEIVETFGGDRRVGGIDDVRFELVEMVGGELLPIDSTALILAGAQTNAVWIMSALAIIGSVAFGALYITSKKN